jgi:hypothetical protein
MVYIEETRNTYKILGGKLSKLVSWMHNGKKGAGNFKHKFSSSTAAETCLDTTTLHNCLPLFADHTSILQVCHEIKSWWAGGRTRTVPQDSRWDGAQRMWKYKDKQQDTRRGKSVQVI